MPQRNLFHWLQIKFKIDILALKLRNWNPKQQLVLLFDFGPKRILTFQGWTESEPAFLLYSLGQI